MSKLTFINSELLKQLFPLGHFCFNRIRPGVLDPGKNPGGGGGTKCLTLKFGVCIENYVQIDKIKRKIQKNFENDQEIEFLKKFRKIFGNLRNHKNVHHSVKFQYFEL